MGAKTPEQITKVRPTVKCDVCGRKFLNAAALKSHYKFLHILKPDGTKRVAHRKQETMQLRKKVVPVHMLTRVKPSPESNKEKNTEVAEDPPDLAGKVTTPPKKPEFECPVCEEKFPVYFTAFRHIQKSHCVDEKGEKVPPNSPKLVKPTRIEMCVSCRKEIRSTEPHSCSKQHTNRDQYLCLCCEQVFSGLVLFQHHVKGFHAEGAQNYFFPTRDEFMSWKTNLQKQAKIEFIILNKQKSKEIYHCSHHSTTDTATELCPSSITVREYMKGIHACYYKEHHGHSVENVQQEAYKQYCISFYTREAEDLQIEAADDNDLYVQFKKMVTCIVYDAAKVDVTTLKELLGKALEMTTVLKHYRSEDRNTPLISKCLTDAQISRTLDTLKRPIRAKRKYSPVGRETKKVEVKKVKKNPSIEKISSSSFENGRSSRLRRSPAVNRSPVSNKSVSFSKSVSNIEESLQNSTLPKMLDETPRKSIEKPHKTIQTKKIEETPQKGMSNKKTDETLQKVAHTKNIEETPQKSISNKKIEDTPQKSLPDKKIEEVLQKSMPNKKIEEIPHKRVSVKKVVEITQKNTPNKKIEDTSQKSTHSKKIEETIQTNTPNKKIEETPQKSTHKKIVSTQKSLPKKVDGEPESKKQESPATPIPRTLIQSPSSFNDSYKNFVDQNFKCNTNVNTSTPRPKPNIKIKKKEVVKTKIGQFKVKTNVTSPKDSSLKDSPKSPKVTKDSKETPVVPKTWKAKEIKYEVKEQENDCNILILKI